MAVYRDQVIAIGTDDVDHALDHPRSFLRSIVALFWSGLWGGKQMSMAERQAFREFTKGYQRADT
jgi:hypothetical protein